MALEPRIRKIAERLRDRFLPAGTCDLMADFAVPLPVIVIAELLGVDSDRQHDFKRWSDALLRAVFDRPDAEEAARIGQCLQELSDYFEEVIAARRRQPADDLISTLVRAEEADGVLTADEVRVFVFTLLVAGNVTTTNLIGNTAVALLEHPEELARATRDLALVPSLVEEALRYDSTSQLLFRTATEDVTLAGVTIPAGSLVAPLFASANRDERVFDDPDRFDVTRDPKDHLAFGHGIHFCLGAPLARLEARVAFETLLPRLVHPVLTEDQVEWIDSVILRGPIRLRLAFDAPRPAPGPRQPGHEDNGTVIRRFIDAWSRLDAAELAAYFCEDGTYHNVPLPPVVGRANIEETIRAFTASWTTTRWEIRHLLASGNVVVAERIDRTRCIGDRSVDLPIVGVFELEQGKIKVWRDYFDLGTYLQAVG
jgi:limonene-1,2-epoxide hydrolase